MRMSLTLFADQELGSHWLAALPLWMYPQLVDQDNDQRILIKRDAEGRNTKTKVTEFKSNTCVCVCPHKIQGGPTIQYVQVCLHHYKFIFRGTKQS